MDGFWNWLIAYTTRWHDTWEIVGALATAAAAAVALWLASRERVDRVRAEQERAAAVQARIEAEEAERRRRREDQARRLVVSATRSVYVRVGQDVTFDITVRYINRSDMEILGCSVMISGRWTALGSRHDKGVVGVLEPGRVVEGIADVHDGPEPELAAIAVRFRDASGVQWDRFADGRLTEVAD